MYSVQNQRVKLVPTDKKFIPNFLEWFNDREVIRHLMMYLPITYEQEVNWYNSLVNNENSILFVILRVDDGSEAPIGNCGLTLNLQDRVGQVGILIGEKSLWGKGYGTDAMALLVNHAFNSRNLHRVELECYSSNTRALKSYEKLGFQREGARKQAIFVRGIYEDVVVMGMLESEWKAQ